ncbi:hypothetical protein LY78DRAFT_664700 [Colletotrichum sublineola]|nr:hypothetical protein LY78DRAFT_664700 [Colletotrichum sublineola]
MLLTDRLRRETAGNSDTPPEGRGWAPRGFVGIAYYKRKWGPEAGLNVGGTL